MSNYNNIFNKKNIEYRLDGSKSVLPHTINEDVTLKANQIIFTSINNIFQKLLDNDLYNEALLKKYVELGLIGGPTYVSSISDVEDSSIIGKKFIVSGDNGLSVLRKTEVDVVDTLSGRFLDGIRVNKITYVDGRFVACAENGIYESFDKINWTKRIGDSSADVIDVTYNQNLLNGNTISTYDYLAIANTSSDIVFYGHDVAKHMWEEIQDITIENKHATGIFSFNGDPKLYVGAKNSGLLASELKTANDAFISELGTMGWTIYDMASIPETNQYENYFIATNYGLKQSRRMRGFHNLQKKGTTNFYSYDSQYMHGTFYVASSDGFLVFNKNGSTKIIDGLKNVLCFSIARSGQVCYVGTTNGVYTVINERVERNSLHNHAIKNVEIFSDKIFAYSSDKNKIYYSNSNGVYWNTLPIDFKNNEYVKQFKKHENTLYVVTNNNIYAIIDGSAIKLFQIQTNLMRDDIYFCKNLTDNEIAIQGGNHLYIFSESSQITDTSAKIGIELEDNKKVIDVIKTNDVYFLLINGEMFKLAIDGGSPELEPIDGITAKKMLDYKNPSFDINGIVLLNENDSITFLSNSLSSTSTIAKNEVYSDIAIYNSDLYAISGNKNIVRFPIKNEKILVEISSFEEENLVSFTEHEHIDKNERTNALDYKGAMLSVFGNSAQLEIDSMPAYDRIEYEGISCGDYIGYANNIKGDKTLLIGGTSQISSFDVNSNIEFWTNENVSTPKVFADAYYRDPGFNNIVNAVNFVGTESGIYALSAKPYFMEKEFLSTIVSVNGAAKLNDGSVLIASNKGIYEFSPMSAGNFICAGYEDERSNGFQIVSGMVFASGSGNNVMISANANDFNALWNPVFVSDDNTVDNFYLSNGTEVSPITSDYGVLFPISKDTITNKSERINSCSAFFNNPVVLTASELQNTVIKALYKDADGITKIVDYNDNVYKVISANPFEIELIDGETPKPIETILSNNLANSFTVIRDRLSLGANFETDDDVNTFLQKNATQIRIQENQFERTINKDNSIVLNNVSDIELEFANETISFGTDSNPYNFNETITCDNISNVIEIDFASSEGIESVSAIQRAILSGTFVHTHYELREIYPQTTVDHDVTIYDPNTGTITISAGEPLSVIDVVQSAPENKEFELSSEILLTPENPSNSLTATAEYFAGLLSGYEISSNVINYKVLTRICNVGYESGYAEFNSKLSLAYQLTTDISVNTARYLTYPVLNETNDGVYYDAVSYIDGDDVDTDLAIYCINIDDKYLATDGSNIYSFDSFQTREIQDNYAFIQIAETSSNRNFNDLYYFRPIENFEQNEIRKTSISDHGKNFSTEKYSTTEGKITKITAESNALYVLKNGDLYCMRSNDFPAFNLISLGDSYEIKDFNSCSAYTLLAVKNENAVSVDLYQNGTFSRTVWQGGEGEFDSLFSFNGNVFIDFVDSIKHYDIEEHGLIEDASFSQRTGVKALFNDTSHYNNDVLIGQDYIYAKEKVYDFENSDYVKIADGSIVDLKAFSKNVSNPCLYVAKQSEMYRVDINGFDSEDVSYSFVKLDNGDFTDIKAIYFNENNTLYLIDKTDLYTFSNFEPGRKISDYYLPSQYLSSCVKNFIPEDSDFVRMTLFDGYDPMIVLRNSTNSINEGPKFVEDDPYSYSWNLKGFISNPSNPYDIYTYSSRSLMRLSSNESSYGVEKIHYNRSKIFDKLQAINTFDDGTIETWELSSDTLSGNMAISHVFRQTAGSYDHEGTSYLIESSPNPNGMFYRNDEVYLGAATSNEDSVPGIYKLGTSIIPIQNVGDPIHLCAETQISRDSSTQFYALEFFKDDFIYNYTISSLIDDEPINRTITVSLFESSDETVKNNMSNGYISQTGVVVLTPLFNKYIFASDGNDGYAYNLRTHSGENITFAQLERENGRNDLMTFLKGFENIGILGYGRSIDTFDEFSYIKVYDKVDSEKYPALANNFRRGPLKIDLLNNTPDALIGSTYGLKYVYDKLMTKSFYNKETDTSIDTKINAIEQVLYPGNNEFFLVGTENRLFEITSLKSSTYRKLFDFPEDEIVLDVFAIQKNEYIIATSKGIYITDIRYELTDDLKRFTINNIYDIINDELSNIIAKHIKADHKQTSLITKINSKARNDLSFISNKDVCKEKFYSEPINSIKVIENDIIETIVRGGETLTADSYVKVGMKNWALNATQTEAIYVDDGFVNKFTDPTSGKEFDISTVPYIVKNWKSGIKEIYIYVPSTATYYINNPQGISNSPYAYKTYARDNVPNASIVNTLATACTTLRVYLYNSYFKIKTIIAAQCSGNSLPLKIYKDNVNADDAWKGVFDTVMQPSVLRSLPIAFNSNVNNVRNCTDDLDRIYLDFSIYGTDAQAIRIIAES